MRNAQRRGVLREGLLLCTSFIFVLSAQAVRPHTSQNITLTYGWNAVYVEVSPEQTADELFAAWPVGHVGLYDPASFLATRQFSAEWNSQGLPREAMAVWYRDAPEASSLKAVPGGSILVTFCNSSSFVDTFRGAPVAPRTTWHVTGTNTVYNFVGFSVSQATDISAYLEGSPCEEVLSRAYYRIVGDDPTSSPQSIEVRSYDRTVSDGGVLLLPSDKISNWSGVLNVSPINGVDFGQTGTQGRLSVRNDGTASRKVRLEFAMPDNATDLFATADIPNAVYFRDPDVIVNDDNRDELYAWSWWEPVNPGALSVNAGFGRALYKTLSPGETWNIDFGLDRAVLQGDDRRKGLSFGFLVKVSEDSAAHAKAVIPVYGETSGEAPDAWDCGLWVADVEFDTVRMVDLKRVISTNEVDGVEVVTTNVVETSLSDASRAGGKFKVRLPVHRDQNGCVRLLQRVVAAGSTAADGTFNYRLYAGTATPPDADKTFMRISAVCLPTETPVIEASGENTFVFTVAGDGATSLLRHPYHPQHDGLRWDFKTRAPDGDDVYNYKSDVKPETFSVQNEIKLEYSYGESVAQWSPQYEFSGTCKWALTGLRHDGVIMLSGPMAIKRVSPCAKLTLK